MIFFSGISVAKVTWKVLRTINVDATSYCKNFLSILNQSESKQKSYKSSLKYKAISK